MTAPHDVGDAVNEAQPHHQHDHHPWRLIVLSPSFFHNGIKCLEKVQKISLLSGDQDHGPCGSVGGVGECQK